MRYLLLLLLVVSCRTASNTVDLEPSCLQETVEKIMTEPPQTPRIEIKQGFYNNDRIYVYSEKRGVSDFAIVLNAECEYLCEIGGIAGTANCPNNIFESLKNLELIWIDPR